MAYEPIALPTEDLTALALALQQELATIAAQFVAIDNIILQELNVAPDKPQEGQVILADGANFNPGSGAGFYGRHNAAWVFLG